MSESNVQAAGKKWFLLIEGQVSGPHSTEVITAKTQSTPTSLVWGRGLPEWVNPLKWQKFEREMDSAILQQKNQNERMWRLKIQTQEYEAMNMSQLLSFLKTQTDFAEIYVWTEGYSEWKEVFQIHRIMDELGVPRRKHPRVPIAGDVQCEGATGAFTARALTISEGGLGISQCPNIKIGEKLKLVIKSPNLFMPIHATAEVVYSSGDSYVGLRFMGLQEESKSAIIEYVKKFLESAPADAH